VTSTSSSLTKWSAAGSIVVPAAVVDVFLILFVAPKLASGWISLVILNLGLIGLLSAFRLAPRQAGLIFGYQLVWISAIFLIPEFIFTLIVLASHSFERWLDKGGEILLALNVLLAVAFLAAYAITLKTQKRIGAELIADDQNLAFVRDASVKLDRIRSLSTDPVFLLEFRKANDAIRYSSAEWVPGISLLEAQMMDEIGQVQMCLETDDLQSALQKLGQIRRLAEERNDAIRLSR